MKKISILFVVLVNMFVNLACTAQENKSADAKKSEIVEVYYFHYTRRCMTCSTVESESKKAVETLYPAQVKSGKVVFKEVNLDEDSSQADAEKCGATGQSLLVVSGDEKVDLTSVGFMNARNNPNKLKEEIKKAVDSML